MAWKEIPTVWACIVAVAQLLIVAMPFFPFLKNGKDFLEMSHDFEVLYLDIEKLWCSLDNEKVNHDESEKLYYEYRERIIKIEKYRGADCPEIKCWMKKVDEKTNKDIEINFYKVNK